MSVPLRHSGPSAGAQHGRACLPARQPLPLVLRPHVARLAGHSRGVCRAAASDQLSQALVGGSSSISASSGAGTSSGACPFHTFTAAVGSLSQPQQPAVQGVSAAAEARAEAAAAAGILGVEEPRIPGPEPLSWDAAMDVSQIFFKGGLHVAMLHFSEKYGPICRFANPASLNGATSWVFLNGPDSVQHVCATNVRNYQRRYLPDIYKFVTHEKGILGSQGEYNARHRKLCQPPFRNRDQLQKFAIVVVERSRQLADIWTEHGISTSDHSRFITDVATQTQRLTLDIVGLTAFSHDFRQTERIKRDMSGTAGDKTQETDRLLWAVNTFGEVLAQVFITPLPLLKLLDKFGLPHLRNLNEAVDTMRGAMLDVIHERRAALAAGEPGQDDLLGVLLQAQDDEGRPMTDEELWEDVHDVMGAGHETTATTVASVLYCISAHPEVEARVAAELHNVLKGEAPGHDDLNRLPYLQQCVKETLRLYPAIPVFPREARADDTLPSGHHIKAGDVVFMSSYALGRCLRIWGPDPLAFDPDRFSPAQEARHHRFQWLPFGAGPRMCLGASFATMSVTLMAATLLQRFRFKPVNPTTKLIPVAYDITMNFQPTNGLRMSVEPRQPPRKPLPTLELATQEAIRRDF